MLKQENTDFNFRQNNDVAFMFQKLNEPLHPNDDEIGGAVCSQLNVLDSTLTCCHTLPGPVVRLWVKSVPNKDQKRVF